MTCRASLRALATCALLLLTACFPHASSSASGPAASPTASVASATSKPLSTAPVYIVSMTPRPVPSISPPRDIVSVAPAPSPLANKTVVYAAPNASPRILAINISSVVIHSGDTVRGNVTTTSNISKVDVHIIDWAMPLQHPRPGYFEGSGVIPQLPFFVKGNYTLQVIAHTAAGAQVERDIPIAIR